VGGTQTKIRTVRPHHVSMRPQYRDQRRDGLGVELLTQSQLGVIGQEDFIGIRTRRFTALGDADLGEGRDGRGTRPFPPTRRHQRNAATESLCSLQY